MQRILCTFKCVFVKGFTALKVIRCNETDFIGQIRAQKQNGQYKCEIVEMSTHEEI